MPTFPSLPVAGITPKHYPDGSVFQGFSENPADYAQFGLKGHNGWDILRGLNAPCLAVADGVIWDCATVGDSEKEAQTKYNGNVVWLLTDEINGKRYYCAYGHLNKVLVSKGQRVKAGETIGLMGNTGFVVSGGVHFWGNAPAGKGVHLHFGIYEVSVSGETINYLNSNNGYKGALDPTPFFTDSIKAEPPEITRLQRIVEALRVAIRKLGLQPVK